MTNSQPHKTFEDSVCGLCQLLMGVADDANAHPQLLKIIVLLNAVCRAVFASFGKLIKFTVRFVGGEPDQNRLGRDGSRYGA